MKKNILLTIHFQKQFRKDFKKAKHSGRSLDKLKEVIDMLQMQQQLPSKYLDHKLSGEYLGWRECHVESDFLLIYRVGSDKTSLELLRIGSHSELFD